MMWIAFAILLACILVLGGVLLLLSPGKPLPIVDKNGSQVPGSIAEKIHININGVEQGMFITSKDPTNPVLLFLHGGPGMPEYFLTQHYPTGLEQDFTVCWWDQRGAGLSFRSNMPKETVTMEQLIADTLEVTNYLRRRFGKEKIYLMGHSGGSFLGIQVAARAPELFYAYIGMAQMGYQLRSERQAYEFLLKHYRANGNVGMVHKLEQAPPMMTVPLPRAYDVLRDEAMHKAAVGSTRDMKSVITGVFVPSWVSPVYTFKEKINLWRGKIFSMRCLRNMVFGTDLTQQVTVFKLPVYFFHGSYDYTCSYLEAKAYFEKIQAPAKGFYTFEQSAHSPMFEEPEKVRRVLQEEVLPAG